MPTASAALSVLSRAGVWNCSKSGSSRLVGITSPPAVPPPLSTSTPSHWLAEDNNKASLAATLPPFGLGSARLGHLRLIASVGTANPSKLQSD